MTSFFCILFLWTQALKNSCSRKSDFLGHSRGNSEVGASDNVQRQTAKENNANVVDAAPLIRNRHYDQKKSSIKDILSNRKFPNKFRLTARIVDYLPLDLSKFAGRQCNHCKRLSV